jgi:double stranded RNA-specific editase B
MYYVFRLVISKFTALIEGQPMHSRRKVLAGIVMTTGPQMEDAKVISVATGTKCINGEHMSVQGASLNDTHAEIIARRCLCDFIYSQLEMHTNPGMLQAFIISSHTARMLFNSVEIIFYSAVLVVQNVKGRLEPNIPFPM